MFELETVAVGCRHYIESLKVQIGDALTLEPEPTNRYDKNAIKVMHGKHLVGYISKDINKKILKAIQDHDLIQVTCTDENDIYQIPIFIKGYNFETVFPPVA